MGHAIRQTFRRHFISQPSIAIPDFHIPPFILFLLSIIYFPPLLRHSPVFILSAPVSPPRAGSRQTPVALPWRPSPPLQLRALPAAPAPVGREQAAGEVGAVSAPVRAPPARPAQ